MIYQGFHNGITRSREIQNGFDNLINCDVHTEIGTLRPQLALAKESGTTITKPCYQAIVPNGDAYLLSKTDGAMFKRAVAGTYSSLRTNANGAHKG